MKKFGIIGCGWLGSKIAAYFFSKNRDLHTFNSSIANQEKNQNLGYNAYQIDFLSEKVSTDFFKDFETIIIALPMSRNKTFEELSLIFTNISTALLITNATVFLCSSTGIYPKKTGNFNENSFSNDELDTKIDALEQIILKKCSKTNILRLGGLMGDDRVFSKYFSQQESLEAVNHIHYQDIIKIIEQIIVKKIHSKIYNVVAPFHPSKKAIFEFQKNKIEIDTITIDSRIISSDLLIKDLNYNFIYPNPVYF